MSSMVIPSLRFRSRDSILWLSEAFGFELQAMYPEDGEPVDHAQLRFGDGWIMCGTREGGVGQPPGSGAAYVVVDTDAEVDAIHTRALAAGATSIREPEDMDYGGRGASLRDPEGNLWSFGSYRPGTGG
jgi:uncharacterized glyoxalase superfamily protein PhnB